MNLLIFEMYSYSQCLLVLSEAIILWYISQFGFIVEEIGAPMRDDDLRSVAVNMQSATEIS